MLLKKQVIGFLLIALTVVLLFSGSVSAKIGLLGNCDFAINQVHLPPDDFQFYSDCIDPPSWITYEGVPISSHPATRHFWLFVQLGFDGMDQAMAQAGVVCRDLEELLSRTDVQDDADLRFVLIETLLEDFRQDVMGKGGYFEVIVEYDSQAPNPNPIADFQLAYPEAFYFYLLVVYNLEMREAADMIWSDFQVAVSLSSFTATAGQGQVILEWTTETEKQNFGFNLLRRCSPEEHFSRINEQLISAASGGYSEVPLYYRFTDNDVSVGMNYEYQLEDINFRGERTIHGTVIATPLAAGAIPKKFRLFQNYPNPFNANTEILYQIPQSVHVNLSIFNVRGELVKVLVNGMQEVGQRLVSWDGRTWSGEIAGSGLYICKLQAGDYQETMKMVLLR